MGAAHLARVTLKRMRRRIPLWSEMETTAVAVVSSTRATTYIKKSRGASSQSGMAPVDSEKWLDRKGVNVVKVGLEGPVKPG